MYSNEISDYVSDLEKKYHEARSDRQEALEIFQDILLDDKAVKADGWKVPEDRINDWINKVQKTQTLSPLGKLLFKCCKEDEEKGKNNRGVGRAFDAIYMRGSLVGSGRKL